MIGTIEKILRERYGDPVVVPMTSGAEYRWNQQNESWRCVLYKAADLLTSTTLVSGPLRRIYGDIVGGSLLLDSLKVATIRQTDIYGLYTLGDLSMQPEVADAKRIDSAIEFFMDASNVWFYGVKENELYVYDSGTCKLDTLGPIEEAVSQLLEEWEQTHSS